MRVVVVSAWEPWRTGDGAATILAHQLVELGERHDITVLAAGAPELTVPAPDAARRALPGVDLRWFGAPSTAGSDQLRRRVRSWRQGEPAHVGYVKRPPLLAALRMATTDPAVVDVVHLHGWGTAALWPRVQPLPTVHVAVDPWALNARNRTRPLSQRVAEIGQRRLVVRHEARHYPQLGTVVVLTPPDAETLHRVAPTASIEVVPNGVEPGPGPRPLPTGPPVIGFHGAFESRANVEAAVALVREVLPRVRRELPEVTALIVGRAPVAAVLDLAGDAVTVRGDVPDLRVELDAVTVHVDWLTSGAGLKNKVLEAMAAARPVVASALGASGIGEGDGVVVAADLDAAAAQVVAWLRDPATATAVGLAGRERVVDDFSWSHNALRIEQLWHRVAEQRR